MQYELMHPAIMIWIIWVSLLIQNIQQKVTKLKDLYIYPIYIKHGCRNMNLNNHITKMPFILCHNLTKLTVFQSGAACWCMIHMTYPTAWWHINVPGIWAMTGSGNGLSPVQHKGITKSNDDTLSTRPSIQTTENVARTQKLVTVIWGRTTL